MKNILINLDTKIPAPCLCEECQSKEVSLLEEIATIKMATPFSVVAKVLTNMGENNGIDFNTLSDEERKYIKRAVLMFTNIVVFFDGYLLNDFRNDLEEQKSAKVNTKNYLNN